MQRLFQWAATEFAAFDVLIGDYFHRHNLEDLSGLDAKHAYASAVNEGQKLSHFVLTILQRIPGSPRLLLASSLCESASYQSLLAEYTALENENADFANAIEAGTDAFLGRFAPLRMKSTVARTHSRFYQLEELAMFEELAREGYSINAYPGMHLPIMRELVFGSLKDLRPQLSRMTLVEIRFRRTK